jgi:hypothetical protein
VITIIASVEVAETIKILLGSQPSLKNKLLYCDVGLVRFEEIRVARVESCPVCGHAPETHPLPLKYALIEEACGRNNRRVFSVNPKENLNLAMKKLGKVLKTEGNSIDLQGEFGITFTTKKGVIVNILKSGIMITEGINTQAEALDFYREIIKKMGVAGASSNY